MKRILSLSILALSLTASRPTASTAADSRPKVMLTGIPWSVMGTSPNGRWICGTRQASCVYRYDTWNEKLEYMLYGEWNDDPAAHDIADDGTVSGCDRGGEPAVWLPGTLEWKRLPIAGGYKNPSAATGITADGRHITGFVSTNVSTDNPFNILPTVWELQPDGTYRQDTLPNPEKDFLGKKPQYVSPRIISADGRRIIGPIVNSNGFYPLPLLYTRGDDGKWTYEDIFSKIIYTDKFYEIIAEEPQMEDYVTLQPGEKGYAAQVNAYIAASEEWQRRRDTEGRTGKDFSKTPIMSDNGRYIAGGATGKDFYGTAVYDLETREYTEIAGTNEKRLQPYGVTNEADIISTDGYDVYLIMHDRRDKALSLFDLMADEYGLDLTEHLPENTEYVDAPAISGDGNTITARYVSVTPDGELDTQEMFSISLRPVLTAIKEALDTPESEVIVIRDGMASLPAGASAVSVYSFSGRLVISAGDTSSVSLAGLGKGIYIIKATVGGREVKTKFTIGL